MPDHAPYEPAPTCRTQNAALDAVPRSLGGTSSYWFAMFAASAFGTNLGDFAVDSLVWGRAASFALLAALSAVAMWADVKAARRTDAAYWIAIVMLRAAATNVGDFLTHEMAFGYLATAISTGVLTLAAGYFTRSDGAGGTPRIDGRYWIAMLIAGIFGTVGGDLAAHALGLYTASAVVCGFALIVLAARNRLAATSTLAYWCVVLAERCAGTPVGDALASRRAVGLGLPLAMLCTSGLLVAVLSARWYQRCQAGEAAVISGAS